MKKYIIKFLLCFVAIIIPNIIFADATYVSTYSELNNAVGVYYNNSNPFYVVLNDDITTSKIISFVVKGNSVLDLNGHDLYFSGIQYDVKIKSQSNSATLTITDSSEEQTGKIILSNKSILVEPQDGYCYGTHVIINGGSFYGAQGGTLFSLYPSRATNSCNSVVVEDKFEINSGNFYGKSIFSTTSFSNINIKTGNFYSNYTYKSKTITNNQVNISDPFKAVDSKSEVYYDGIKNENLSSSGTIYATNNIIVKRKIKLNANDITLDKLYSDYSSDTTPFTTLDIHNSGEYDTKVSVVSGLEDFILTGCDDIYLEKGSDNTSCKIKPKDGLSVDNYTRTVKLKDDNDNYYQFKVNFEISDRVGYYNIVDRVLTISNKELDGNIHGSFDLDNGEHPWNSYSERITSIVVGTDENDIVKPLIMKEWFKDLSNVTSINMKYLDTSKVTTMSSMFSGCSSLTSLNLSNFDTSNVINMSGMFYDCNNLKTIIVSNKWTITNSNDYWNEMFKNCYALTGMNGTKYNSDKMGTEYARIDSNDLPGYLSISINSPKYDLSKKYINVETKDFDISKVIIDNNYQKTYNGSKLIIKDNDVVLKQFDIVSYKSNKYDISDGYIYIGDNDFNVNDINCLNCSVVLKDKKIQIMYGDEIIKEYILYSSIRSISLDKNEISILKNQNISLKATINPANVLGDKTLTWASDNQSVAIVNQNGVINSINSGKARIIVQSSNGKKSECIVNVLAEINNDSKNVLVTVNENAKVGEIVTITVTPNAGYKVSDIRILKKADGKDVTKEVNYSNNQFTMPNYETTVKVDAVSLKLSNPSVSISQGNNNSLVLNWNKQETEKYIIYRSTDKKKYKEYKTVTTSSFTDTGLTYGTTYYYKVKAYNSYNGYTEYSNVVYKKVVPNKVTNLKTTSITKNTIKLSFDKVSTTGYEVYRSTNNKSWSKVSTITKNSTLTYTNKKLKTNTNYYYKVRAYKTVKGKKIYGSYSDVLKVKTAPDKGKLSVSLKDYNALNIKVTSIKGAAKYQLYRSTDNKNFTLLSEVNAGTYTDTNVTLGTTYYYKVRACNSEGTCGSFSSVSKLKVTPKTPSISLKTTSKKVTITTKSITAGGYEVYRATSKKGKYTKVGENTFETLSIVNSTKKKKTYYYKIRSYIVKDGKKVYSPYSSIKSIKSK